MNSRRLSALTAKLAVLAITIATLPALPMYARTKLTPVAPRTAAPASTRYTINAESPTWQAKTQAQVVGYIYGSDKVFDGVIVFNASTTTLTEVQIGVFLEGIPGGLANPVDLGFVPFGTGPVEIAPNALGLVTMAPLTIADLNTRIDGREMSEVVATLGIVNARWANGKRFVAQDISNGFITKPNVKLDAKWTLVEHTLVATTIEDLTSIWHWPIIVTVPDDDDFYYCKTVTGWQCLMRVGTNECGGSIKCTSCTGSTSRKCVKLVLPEFEPV
jgi:hypothetical protein